MSWLILIAGLIILLFGFVVLFGAPYLPTMKRQTDMALELLDLKPGQTMIELGCGDGRLLKAAAQKGIHVVGYELNPILILVSYVLTWKYRENVKIIWGDYWQKSWPKADGIYTFLLQKYMKKLDTKIVQEYGKNVKLVSFAFKIPNKQPAAEKHGLFLYKY